MSVTAILRQMACDTQRMRTATFDQWIDAAFDHPVRKREWYWDEDFESYWDRLELSDAVTVAYMTRLFLAPDHLKRYSLEQVAQGIWFLIAASSPGKSAYALLSSEVPLNSRSDCVRAMANFFRMFVAPVAPGRANEQKDDFQSACYMWWDIFPTYGGPRYGNNTGGEPELDIACLSTMAEILSISSELCQLSALHGLNHWHRQYGEEVEEIVDSFLQKTPSLTARIIEYAGKARVGGTM
jgi:hypothetical protein